MTITWEARITIASPSCSPRQPLGVAKTKLAKKQRNNRGATAADPQGLAGTIPLFAVVLCGCSILQEIQTRQHFPRRIYNHVPFDNQRYFGGGLYGSGQETRWEPYDLWHYHLHKHTISMLTPYSLPIQFGTTSSTTNGSGSNADSLRNDMCPRCASVH